MPDPPPDVDLRAETRVSVDGYVRIDTADYSVPPAFVGRRVSVRVTTRRVHIACEGSEIAVHDRSFVPADVVLAPAHGRATRLAREAADRLRHNEPELPPVDLARYDALFGALR